MKKIELLLVMLIVGIGLVLRVAFVGHGLPDFEQPDEIDFVGPALNQTFNLSEALKTHNLGLLDTDYFYAHPQGFPNLLFITFTIAKEVGQVGHTLFPNVINSVHDWPRDYFFIIARVFTGLASTLTLVVIFLMGKKFFNKKVAYLALLTATFFYYFIMYSHTASPYPVNALFNLLLLLFLFNYKERQTQKNLLGIGVTLGLSMTTNFGSVVMLLPTLIVFGQLLIVKKIYLRSFLVLVGVSIFTFFIFSPLTIIHYDRTLEALRSISSGEKNGCVQNSDHFGPFYYFFGDSEVTSGFSSFAVASFKESSGLFFPIVAALSLIFALFSRNRKAQLLGLTFLAALILYSLPQGKYLRWLVPFTPILILLTSIQLVRLDARLFGYSRKVFWIFVILAILTPNLYRIYYYLSAFSRPDTRELALNYILETFLRDTVILRPTNYSPPIWRYDYKYNLQISYPLCASSKEILSSQAPGLFEDYMCDPETNLTTHYAIAVDSVINPLLTSSAASNYPNLHKAWEDFNARLTSYPEVASFNAGFPLPRTGPNIRIYDVSGVDCSNYLQLYENYYHQPFVFKQSTLSVL